MVLPLVAAAVTAGRLAIGPIARLFAGRAAPVIAEAAAGTGSRVAVTAATNGAELAATTASTALRGSAARLAAEAAEQSVSIASMAGPTAARTAATAGAEAAATAVTGAAGVAGEVVATTLAPSLLGQTAVRVATTVTGTGAVAVGTGHVVSEAVKAPFAGIVQVIEAIGRNALPIAMVAGAVVAGVGLFNHLRGSAPVKPTNGILNEIVNDGTLAAKALRAV